MILYTLNTTACDGSDVFWPWLLWMLGAFLLGLLIGWLLRSFRTDQVIYPDDYEQLKVDLDNCRRLQSTLARGATVAGTTTVSSSIVNKVVSTIPEKEIVKDNLKKVEGIGPKIQSVLNESGIWSFSDLAASSTEKLQEILDAQGPRYRVHNPKTWAAQASLADAGKWEELKKWQDELNGGL